MGTGTAAPAGERQRPKACPSDSQFDESLAIDAPKRIVVDTAFSMIVTSGEPHTDGHAGHSAAQINDLSEPVY